MKEKRTLFQRNVCRKSQTWARWRWEIKHHSPIQDENKPQRKSIERQIWSAKAMGTWKVNANRTTCTLRNEKFHKVNILTIVSNKSGMRGGGVESTLEESTLKKAEIGIKTEYHKRREEKHKKKFLRHEYEFQHDHKQIVKSRWKLWMRKTTLNWNIFRTTAELEMTFELVQGQQ